MTDTIAPTKTSSTSGDTHREAEMAASDAANLIDRVHARVSEVILDKAGAIRILLAGLLASGHVLIEDTPGVGKTTLAQALAISLGLKFNRLPFTADLLPSDVTGGAIFDRTTGTFKFHPGPVFAQVVLADEINRAGPKTQSALLEAMEERRVTVDGIPHELPAPFLVIATQNPVHHAGTHALPESQLDRFLLTLGLGYPSSQAEVRLLMGENPRDRLPGLAPVLLPGDLLRIFAAVRRIHISEALATYIHRIAAATRDGKTFEEGLSPRSLIGLVQASKAWTLMRGGNHVTPDDVRAIYPFVAAHRLVPLNEQSLVPGPSAAGFHEEWLRGIPSER